MYKINDNRHITLFIITYSLNLVSHVIADGTLIKVTIVWNKLSEFNHYDGTLLLL